MSSYVKIEKQNRISKGKNWREYVLKNMSYNVYYTHLHVIVSLYDYITSAKHQRISRSVISVQL